MYNGALADMSLGTDPFTGNRYAFTSGNPVNRLEHDGHRITECDGPGTICPWDLDVAREESEQKASEQAHEEWLDEDPANLDFCQQVTECEIPASPSADILDHNRWKQLIMVGVGSGSLSLTGEPDHEHVHCPSSADPG
jgi:epoxyqueuosine reductase QueG